MGKKAEADLLREQFFHRESRRRAALRGPFICPKCLGDGKLQCQVTRKDVRESRTSITGETSMIITNYTHYLFLCNGCDFRKPIVRRTTKLSHVVDVYSNLYDEELSASQRQEQINLISDRNLNIIKLPEQKVKWRTGK